jgi:DDE superfamily endonuclease/Helix-turn-helix of DDE superfamily endonuclease
MLKYEKLKDKPRELLAATGLKREEFEKLLEAFRQEYAKAYPGDRTMDGQPRKRRQGGGNKGSLYADEEKLLFMLVYAKTYPLQTMHGLQFGMSQGQVNQWIHRLTPILQAALSSLGMTPERDGRAVADSALANEGGPDLLIDGTERRRQRPQAHKEQTAHYSGKKKAHTDKNVVVVNRHSKKVAYLSATRPGKVHDKKLADDSLIVYPKLALLGKDTGFQGYAPPLVLSYQPKKTKRS